MGIMLKILQEALRLSQYRPYVKKWNKNRYKEWFDGKYRLYFNVENNNKIVTIPDDIRHAIENEGYHVEDYVSGIATKNGDSKNIFKIGKILTKIGNPVLKNKFDSDLSRGASRIKSKENLIVVISRHPYDIAGMSTDRGWWSCMSLGGDEIVRGEKDTRVGSHVKELKKDIKEGTLVAYLITDKDLNIRVPLSKITLKPYIHEESGKSYLVPNPRQYGASSSELVHITTKWLEEKQGKLPKGEYSLNPNVYQDFDMECDFWVK